MLGFQRRGVRLWEKLTDLPKLGRLPHTSQTAAMSVAVLSGGVPGGRTGRGFDNGSNGSTRSEVLAHGLRILARMPVQLEQPLADVAAVRPALVRAVEAAFGYGTVRDLLEHYPR